MSKKRKKKVRLKEHTKKNIPKAMGFDFGELRKILALADTEFNQKLRDAKIFACAYGFQQVAGAPNPIPCITLIVENQKAIESAFEHFKRWGCETDGDSVEIHIILKRNKSYEMWINPEMYRSLYRTVPQADLFNPIIMNMSYIKKFDTTNNFLLDLKEYLDSSMMSPVLVTFGMNPSGNLNPNAVVELKHLPNIIKFDLKIDFENEDGSNPKFGKQKQQNEPKPNNVTSPSDYCKNRKTVFDIAFPITRERIIAANYTDLIREHTGCKDLSQSQIIQAIINLILSNELKDGSLHYQHLKTKNYRDVIWQHIDKRIEVADGKALPKFLTPELISEQIRLDILSVLDKNQKEDDLNNLQGLFRNKGFVND